MSLEPHRVVGSRLLRVRVDRERCQGHARCVAVASALFQLDAFGSAHEVSDGTVPPDPEVEARLAAADCPELAISNIEESVADLRTRPPVADWLAISTISIRRAAPPGVWRFRRRRMRGSPPPSG
jgi:ferredoxin